jgi:patatin-like phospholipase/acyl hydrolase
MSRATPFRILTLDGGGAKGAYTLGALKEIEARLGGEPLCSKFDMIFGTSTGAIIASLVGLGWSVQSIYDLYLKLIPDCFSRGSATAITRQLEAHAKSVFGERRFEHFQTRIGIVATNLDQDRAMIFKSNIDQLYSGSGNYLPGFGATIADAVLASSAAVPYLLSRNVRTETDGMVHTADGGFVANNPALFAVTDAVGALGKKQEEISLISIGTGRFVEKEPNASLMRRLGLFLVNNYMRVDIFSKSMSASAEAADRVVRYAFPKMPQFRLSEHFPAKDFHTHLLEFDANKLEKMYAFGRQSFCEKERTFDSIYSPTG